MGISTIVTVLTLLSGVALFLYGMQLMGEGLKNTMPRMATTADIVAVDSREARPCCPSI